MISKETLKIIDPGIRKLIELINNLSFVDQTLACCAGFGIGIIKHIDGSIFRHQHYNYRKATGAENWRDRPYLFLKYKEKGWKKFHLELIKIVGTAEDDDRVYGKRCWVYRLEKQERKPIEGYEDYKHAGYYKYLESLTIKQIKERWKAIESLVRQYLAKERAKFIDDSLGFPIYSMSGK